MLPGLVVFYVVTPATGAWDPRCGPRIGRSTHSAPGAGILENTSCPASVEHQPANMRSMALMTAILFSRAVRNVGRRP
jgi:hypothetical protein